MTRPFALPVLAAAALAFGCGDRGPTPRTGGPTPGDAAGKGPNEPAPAGPPTPYVPSSALPPIEVAAASPCRPLPSLTAEATEAQRALVPYAAALRRLACEPALYGLLTPALAAELGLPAAAEVNFSGPRTASVTLPEGVTVGDLAAVFGVADPKVRITWQAYHAMTSLGTDPTTGEFDLFSPGRLNVQVAHEVDKYGEGAGVERVVAASADAAIGRTVYSSVGESALKILADPDAVPVALSALERLAASPELLARDPEAVRPSIGLEGERYRVARVSSHSGELRRDGLSLDPRRTILAADAFAAALGLTGAVARNTNGEHDIWEIEADGTTALAWRGLEVSITVDSPAAAAGPSAPLAGLEVRFLSILPAG